MPSWIPRFGLIPNTTVASGYRVDARGNVPADPQRLADDASKKLGVPISLTAYTLARYVTTEVGTKSVGERVAVIQDALNRVNYVEKTGDVLKLLLYRQPPGHPNRGFYGPIHGRDSSGAVNIQSAPYGRWAATTRDPTLSNLMIVKAVLDGEIPADFNKGGDDQMGPEHLNDPVGSVRSHATRSRQYWVGPLPGVDPWRTITYRTMKDVDPNSELGQRLIARGVAAMQAPRPDWSTLPACGDAPRAGSGGGLDMTTAGKVAVGGAVVTAAAVVAAAVYRRRRGTPVL